MLYSALYSGHFWDKCALIRGMPSFQGAFIYKNVLILGRPE